MRGDISYSCRGETSLTNQNGSDIFDSTLHLAVNRYIAEDTRMSFSMCSRRTRKGHAGGGGCGSRGGGCGDCDV